MSDQLPDEPERDESRALPVLWGLLSLVAVAVIVGGVLAVGASVATRVTGLTSDGEESTAQSTARETLYLPEPTDVGSEQAPIELPDVDEPPLPRSTFSETPAAPETEITLSTDQSQVGQMEEIYIDGTYTGGDGAVLQVQQFKDGGWADFPVNVSVNGEQFSTFIQAGRLGENRFRVADPDSDEVSNEIKVTIQ